MSASDNCRFEQNSESIEDKEREGVCSLIIQL